MKKIITGISMFAIMFCFLNCGGKDSRNINDSEQMCIEIEEGRKVNPLIEDTPYCEE